ncbi:hypothetical protein CLBKND_01628 [Methylorubrum aminovorans]
MTEQRPTADNSEQRDVGRAMLAVFSALDFIRHEGITPASAQALLAIAIQTTRDATPRIATPSAIAERLGMSLSAVSRLLSKLVEEGGPELLTSDSSLLAGRSEAYALTEKGRAFVAGLMAAHGQRQGISIETHSIESYTQAVWTDRRAGGTLKQTAWDDRGLVLTVQPSAAAESEELQTWIEQHLTPGTAIEGTPNGAKIGFKSPHDAVWFKLRWC